MEERWKIPIDNWDEVDKESLSFILETGRKYYDAVYTVSSNITSRSYILLAIIISFISIFASLLFTDNFSSQCYPIYYYIWVFPLCSAFILLTINILPHKMKFAGYIPKNINYQEFFNLGKPELIINALIMDRIEDVQQKIEFTEKTNKKRIKFLISGIILTFCSVLYPIIILFI